jgi:hypothetical protein
MSNKIADIHHQIAEVAKNYHYHKPLLWFAYLRDWLAAAYRWLMDWLTTLLSIIHIEADTSTIGNFIKALFLILAAFSVCLLLLLSWRRLQRLTNNKAISQTTDLNPSKPFDAQDWFNEAIESSKAKSWKVACRALYMSCLRLFDERGILPFVATRTNFEVWYALTKYKDLAQIFRSLASTVDMLWFGTKAAQENDFLSCLSNLKDIQAQVEAIDNHKNTQSAD